MIYSNCYKDQKVCSDCKMRLLSTRDHITQILITVDHSTDFNSEQSSHHIISYKDLEMTYVKQLKLENKRPYLCTK